MFKAKTYRVSAPYSGAPGPALAVARTALLSLGFELTDTLPTGLSARGPGMHSNQQPELLGVSIIHLEVGKSSIDAVAELGAAARMRAFIYLFPPGLLLFMFLVFKLSGMDVSWVHGLWILPWFVLSPWMGGMFERRSMRAVDRLVNGMAQSDPDASHKT